MPISVSCPGCEAKYQLADTMAGKRVKCMKCNEQFVAKDPAAREKDAGAREAVSAQRAAPKPAAEEPPRKGEWGEDDDDRDEPRPKRRSKPAKSSSGAGTVVLIVGGVLLALLVVCGGGFALGFYLIFNEARAVQKQIIMNPPIVFNPGQPPGVFDPAQPIVVPGGPPGMVPPGMVFVRPPPQPLDMVALGAAPIKIALNADGTFTQNNVLQPTDTKFENKPFKLYEVPLEKGKTYQIDLIGSPPGGQFQFDAWLRLYGPNNEPIAQDDDSGGLLNSRLVYTPTVTGTHKIHATCLGAVFPGRGNYTFVIRKTGG